MPQIQSRSTKIANRERIMTEAPRVEMPPRQSSTSATYILCDDGDMIRVEDLETLARIHAYDDPHTRD
jgi:hypothetical protein